MKGIEKGSFNVYADLGMADARRIPWHIGIQDAGMSDPVGP
jgi:hypothetical protein